MEIIYTPVHGSWLNMAKIEFAALSRQVLSRAFAAKFANVRIKLAKLYPTISCFLIPGSLPYTNQYERTNWPARFIFTPPHNMRPVLNPDYSHRICLISFAYHVGIIFAL